MENKAFLNAAKTAQHTGTDAAGGHRAGIRIGQRELLVGAAGTCRSNSRNRRICSRRATILLERVDIHLVQMNALTRQRIDMNARGVCS